jgi:dihydroxyacetone kinase-like predicted kinase
MATLTGLAAADLRRAVLRYRDALRAHQEELNRLNVYPVPDGDTGTNMALTLESVSAELATAETMEEVCHAISRGSDDGCRGNSGVITCRSCGASPTSSALDHVAGVDRTRPCAACGPPSGTRPVEGLIPTVVRGGGSRRRR